VRIAIAQVRAKALDEQAAQIEHDVFPKDLFSSRHRKQSIQEQDVLDSIVAKSVDNSASRFENVAYAILELRKQERQCGEEVSS
jgi:hypothetical protein